jgi:NAD(P)H-dependent flavin oxidoreductase YrpB (nitropropane dioxygenase family)
MRGPLGDLGVANPVFAAPMSGGPTTPAMVIAARRAESFGFLAGGYKSAAALSSQIQDVRTSTATFGVNLFAPNPLPVRPDLYQAYAAALQAEGLRYELDLSAVPPREDEDEWGAKIDLLTREPVPVVSFTFGVPERPVVDQLRRAGSILVQTVTSAAEARLAVEAGVDGLAVQSHEAGGHFATLTPRSPSPPVALVDLVTEVRAATVLPIVAAGGLTRADSIRDVLRAGADAAMVGTYLLRTEESGASATYKTALADRRDAPTAVTTAFSGRPARGIRNAFMDMYETMAPLGYPAVHYLTSPLRRAAAAAGDPDRINLWAGTGHSSTHDGSVLAALTALAKDL